MDERLLHYIWKFQKFDSSNLTTSTHEPIAVFHPGYHNHDSGPDFADARLRIGEVQWAGHVEIHNRASDWKRHGHQHDPAYDNVVLHVVYDPDTNILRPDGTVIPTVSLKGRLSPTLIDRHKALTHTVAQIPCDSQIANVEPLSITSMIERTVMERLEEKSSQVREILLQTRGDWEQANYVYLATSLGMKTNAESFKDLALSLRTDVVRKHVSKPMQVEALVFGMSGFLDYDPIDEYQRALQSEFQYLFKKYNLQSKLNKSQWKFSRLRPANFPTLRLAQLSAILCSEQSLFSRLIQATSFADVSKILSAHPSDYWSKNYDFGKPSKKTLGPPGKTAISSIIINAIVPLLVTYGKQTGNQALVDKAVDWLTYIPAEDNKITRLWTSLGVGNASAFDSQGLLQLTKKYCDQRRCLDCAVGNRILSS